VRQPGSRWCSSSAALAQAVQAGQVDVQHRHVRAGLERGGQDLVAAVQLGDDLHVLLQRQQRDQGTADQVLVLSQQHPDHRGAAPMGLPGSLRIT
jgi:hypothetical protein